MTASKASVYFARMKIKSVGPTTLLTNMFSFFFLFTLTQEGRTAVHMAAANGYVDTARALILAGAKVNALDAVSFPLEVLPPLARDA